MRPVGGAGSGMVASKNVEPTSTFHLGVALKSQSELVKTTPPRGRHLSLCVLCFSKRIMDEQQTAT